MLNLLAVGLNFRTAPIEIRERLAFPSDDLARTLARLPNGISEGILLSTCNRTELYVVTKSVNKTHQLIDFLAAERDINPTHIVEHCYTIEREDVVRHVFAVAAGIDSMVVGEPQILGQVRKAFETANAVGCVGRILGHLFRNALRVGKRARSETDVSRYAVSMSYASVELARKIFGSVADCQALVIGAGEMGELTARTLVDNGLRRVVVTNRTASRACEVAERVGGSTVDFGNLSRAIADADVVISSTDASDYVVTVEHVLRAMHQRRHRPLFVVDLAVPRDVDPAIQNVDDVFLYNVDDLQAICEANRRERQREVRRVEVLIDEEVTRFAGWWRTQEIIPTVAALRDQAERIRQGELTKALGKLGDMSDEERSTLNAMTQAIVNKILHSPISRLKDPNDTAAQQEYARALRYLFGLDDEATDHSRALTAPFVLDDGDTERTP